MDCFGALIEWELQILLFGYCSLVLPCCRTLLFYAAVFFHYSKFLSALIFRMITPLGTEKALENHVHWLQKSVQDLDDDSIDLERKLEDLEQEYWRSERLLSRVMAERRTLVTRLEYLELCFEKASKHDS